MKQLAGRKPRPIRGQAAALLAQGVLQKDVAKALNVSRSTIERIARATRQDRDLAEETLKSMQRHVERVLPAKRTIESMAELLKVAETTKQPAAGLSIIQYTHKLQGVVTESDRLRYVSDRMQSQNRVVPMFSLPPGSRIAIQVGNPDTTTGRDEAGLHKIRSVTPQLLTTSSTDSDTASDKDSKTAIRTPSTDTPE